MPKTETEKQQTYLKNMVLSLIGAIISAVCLAFILGRNDGLRNAKLDVDTEKAKYIILAGEYQSLKDENALYYNAIRRWDASTDENFVMSVDYLNTLDKKFESSSVIKKKTTIENMSKVCEDITSLKKQGMLK